MLYVVCCMCFVLEIIIIVSQHPRVTNACKVPQKLDGPAQHKGEAANMLHITPSYVSLYWVHITPIRELCVPLMGSAYYTYQRDMFPSIGFSKGIIISHVAVNM